MTTLGANCSLDNTGNTHRKYLHLWQDLGRLSIHLGSYTLLLVFFAHAKAHAILMKREEQLVRTSTMQRRCKLCYQSLLSTPGSQRLIWNGPNASTPTSWD